MNLLYILLNVKKDIKISNYIRPLGFNKKGSNYLKNIKDEVKLPIIYNYSNYKDLLSFEYKVNSIYSLKTSNVNENIKNEFNKPIIK